MGKAPPGAGVFGPLPRSAPGVAAPVGADGGILDVVLFDVPVSGPVATHPAIATVNTQSPVRSACDHVMKNTSADYGEGAATVQQRPRLERESRRFASLRQGPLWIQGQFSRC
jgi:hypothetical protein